MKTWTPKTLVLSITLALALSTAIALAQERKPGDRLAYDITSSGQSGQKGTPGYTMTMTLTVKSIDPDGTSHATGTMSMPKVPQMGQASFQATISPGGAIVPQFDPNMKPTAHMSNEQLMAFGGNEMAMSTLVQFRMANFNGLANACAQRTLKVGDSWQAPSDSTIPMNVKYTVTGREQEQGHDAFAIAMEGSAESPTQAASLSAKGYCDPEAHLVVSIHSEMKNSSNQSGITDIVLRP